MNGVLNPCTEAAISPKPQYLNHPKPELTLSFPLSGKIPKSMVLFQLSRIMMRKNAHMSLVEHNRMKAKHAGLAASPNP